MLKSKEPMKQRQKAKAKKTQLKVVKKIDSSLLNQYKYNNYNINKL